jgi:predicted CXXCH cytochrome family protein
MKTRTILAGVGIVCTSIGAAVWADIANTDHNFSNETWGSGEICKPCHTPHNANAIGYLWAHTLSTATYTLFEGDTSSAGGVDELDIYSRMCLSCHDGTVALGDYHNGPGAATPFIPEGKKIGTDLSNDHPIGEEAAYNVAGSSSWQPATFFPGPGLYGFGGGFFPTVPLFNFGGESVVSCSTCHNPHGKTGIPDLLRVANTGSALCLTCHIK